MKRPCIALWIKWHNSWPMPRWLWFWAVRRVDKWHGDFVISPFTGRIFHADDPIDWPDR